MAIVVDKFHIIYTVKMEDIAYPHAKFAKILL